MQHTEFAEKRRFFINNLLDKAHIDMLSLDYTILKGVQVVREVGNWVHEEADGLVHRAEAEVCERLGARYGNMLLSGRVRLKDIPKEIRLGETTAMRIHIYAFRADRHYGPERYREDLEFMSDELQGLPLGRLRESLAHEYELAKSSLQPLEAGTLVGLI